MVRHAKEEEVRAVEAELGHANPYMTARKKRRPARYPVPNAPEVVVWEDMDSQKRETMALKQARDLFFIDKRDVDWFERAVESILMGGHLDHRGAVVFGSCPIGNSPIGMSESKAMSLLRGDEDLVYAKITVEYGEPTPGEIPPPTASPFREPEMENVWKP